MNDFSCPISSLFIIMNAKCLFSLFWITNREKWDSQQKNDAIEKRRGNNLWNWVEIEEVCQLFCSQSKQILLYLSDLELKQQLYFLDSQLQCEVQCLIIWKTIAIDFDVFRTEWNFSKQRKPFGWSFSTVKCNSYWFSKENFFFKPMPILRAKINQSVKTK